MFGAVQSGWPSGSGSGFVTSRPDRVDERLREYDRASRWSGRGIDRDVFFFSSTGERLYVLRLEPDRGAAVVGRRDEIATRAYGLREVRFTAGAAPGVIVSDSFGRAWREGQANVAIGSAGVEVMRDYRGARDTDGYELQGTMLAVGDELAAAAELVMGKLDRVPVVLVRGASVAGEGDARGLLRDPGIDLFR